MFSLLPFLSLHVLLLVNYYFQGSRFNEAFYYHFNKLGVVGHEYKVLVLLIVTCCYYVFLCFLTFKLQSRKTDNRFGMYSGAFIVLLALVSPQALSFAGMYLNVHSNHPLAQYLLSIDAIGDPAVNRLIEDAEKDFEYNPEEKKNLIFIYAESLEANFFDKELFPGRFNFLDDIQGSSIEFTNIVQTPYTGWTIAGMVSSLCGIPLQMPLDSSSFNFSLYDDFMPNAECISDLLSKENYNMTYLGGADLDFAGKKAFLQAHGFNEIIGKKNFIGKYPENEENFNDWGLRDRLLFQEAMKRFVRFSHQERPFGMFLLTLDTHAPGYPDPVCKQKYKEIENNKMLDAVRCSTFFIKAFIQEVRNSAYSDQTVIVVMSDHLAHSSPAHRYLKRKDRKLMFMVNLPSGTHLKVENSGTHYDVGPTVLKMLGFDNHQPYGFGHNMVTSTLDEGSFKTRDGLLPEQFTFDRIRNIVKLPQVKTFVRTKWGDYLGGINEQGVVIDEANYTIKVGDKLFSFRHPNPSKTTTPGALLFLLERDDYKIKDIISLNDFIRLPEGFSIQHWLTDKEGIYLYVGSKHSLPFLKMEEQAGENVVAFLDPAMGTGTVLSLDGKLSLSLNEVNDNVKTNKVIFTPSYNNQNYSVKNTEKKKGISMLSCLNDVCQSHIEGARHDIYTADWGISVFQVADSGSIESLVHIDHCGDRESYNNAAGLNELVESANQSEQTAVVLIGHNSVFCDPKKDLNRWSEPFALEKLSHVKFKQPYIGVINLRDNTIEEFVGDEFVQATF